VRAVRPCILVDFDGRKVDLIVLRLLTDSAVICERSR